MENLLDNWKSSQELIKVRRQRLLRICHGLSISGSIFLLFFGAIGIANHNYIIATILLVSMFVALVNSYILKVKDNLEQSILIINTVLLVLALMLLYTGGVNNSGILWLYPLFAISLFINRFSVAVYISIFFITLSGIIVLTPLINYIPADFSDVIAFRFVLTLLALAIICLVTLYSEERAYELILKLHSNDIHNLAFYDSLTGLSNRWSFQQNLQKLIEQQESPSIALLYIDLDNFKLVNDNYGHDTGDNLLVHFSKQLSESLHDIDVARLSGDEFVVTLKHVANPHEAEIVAKQILSFFKEGYELDGMVYPVFASIGICLSSNAINMSSQLIRYADAAMYKAKKAGNNNYCFFDADIAAQLFEKQSIETSLKQAIDSHDFSLVYQPIFSCQTGNMVAIEALVRCHNEGLSGYGPDKFIPAAESTGLIKELDLWVIENAIKDFIHIRQSVGFTGKLAINISGLELLNSNFPQKVKDITEKLDIPCSVIDIEVTETALVADNPTVIQVLNDFSNQGFSISLDDFGTGYTSFNQLILYPAKSLKIDRSFTNALFDPGTSQAKVVQTIHDLAKIYKLRLIAEGVETKEQLDYLKKLGCDWVQGYFLSHPIERDEIITLLRKEYEAKATANTI